MSEKPDYKFLKGKVEELSKGIKDRTSVENRLLLLIKNNFSERKSDDEILAAREEILNRVQKKAEEYEQVTHSCAKSGALAVMEEFGFGDIKMIKALSAMPGVALTGETCGAVLGGLFTLGSYFGSDDALNYKGNIECFKKSRQFIDTFEKELGTTKCRLLHETVVFGQYFDTSDGKEGYPNFLKNNGYERCSLIPGISARIMTNIILDHIESKK